MKKIIGLFFALAIILSLAFVGEMTTGHNPLAAKAQVTVKKKRVGGVVGATARGAKYIYRKGKNGVVYVYRKTKKGTVYVGKKTYQGGKYVGTKTVQGTKYVTRKTVKGTKKVYNKTKDVLVGH
ncbi:MAG: hypothetical protein ACR2N3_02800 [Pyrinomonadaceae bacterium]